MEQQDQNNVQDDLQSDTELNSSLDNTENKSSTKKVILGGFVLAALIAGGAGYFLMNKEATAPSVAQLQTNTVQQTPSNTQSDDILSMNAFDGMPPQPENIEPATGTNEQMLGNVEVAAANNMKDMSLSLGAEDNAETMDLKITDDGISVNVDDMGMNVDISDDEDEIIINVDGMVDETSMDDTALETTDNNVSIIEDDDILDVPDALIDTSKMPNMPGIAPIAKSAMQDKVKEQEDIAKKIDMSKPTDAEMALVQGQDLLNQLETPNKDQLAVLEAEAEKEIPVPEVGRAAIIRPLPKSFLILKKDHGVHSRNSRLSAARRALDDNRDKAALEIFNSLYKGRGKKDKRILMGRAISLHKLGRYNEAIGAYEKTLKRDPRNLEALSNMLGILRMEEPNSALSKLQELRDVYPSNISITAQLGITYGDLKQYNRAMNNMEIAMSLDPYNPSHVFNSAVILDRAGRRNEAVKMYRHSLVLARQNTSISRQNPIPVDVIKRRLIAIR